MLLGISKRLGWVVSAAAVISIAFSACREEPAVEKPRKVLFAIVDGIPADVIERVSTPWIDSIAAKGGYSRAYTGGEIGSYSETPTISAVCYANLVTGTWVNKHNVWDNGIDSINYQYPSVFWYLKNQYPEKKIGIFSTWQDNRVKLLGEGRPETGQIKMDYYADGYELDTVAFPHDTQSRYIHLIDERVSEEAARAIEQHGPDLSWVYLQYTDDVGHHHGDSPQMDSAVVVADNQVGRLWKAVQYRMEHFDEDWLVYIVTDHGRDDRGYHHGGQTPRERGIWMATNDRNLNSYFHEHTPALVDVAPTILRFLDIDAPKHHAFELDGIPLSGDVTHQFTRAVIEGDSLRLEWLPFRDTGELKVRLSTSNHQRLGDHDNYVALAEVPLKDGAAQLDISGFQSDFFKIVLESDAHSTNRWVIRPAQQK